MRTRSIEFTDIDYDNIREFIKCTTKEYELKGWRLIEYSISDPNVYSRYSALNKNIIESDNIVITNTHLPITCVLEFNKD